MSGFDVEVAKYVAKELGVEESGITWKETPSAQRETALQNQEVDFIVATYSITDKRKQVVDFAGPYFIAHQDLLVKSDNTSICGPNDLNGKLLCSVKGSTSAQRIKDTFAADVQLKEYGGYSDCVQALKTGAVDAVTTDDVILAGYAAQESQRLQGRRQRVQQRELRRRHPQGRHRRHRSGQRGAAEDDRRRQLGEGPEGHRRAVRLHHPGGSDAERAER